MSINFDTLNHADWSHAFEMGMKSASTFRQQSNLVIMGAVALFWKNSKNTAYLNSALQYANAYRGIRVEGVKGFIVHHTGAKYDSKADKFAKAGSMKECPKSFYDLESWVDWANEKAPERKFDAVKDEQSILKTLERKLDTARDALGTLRNAAESDDDTDLDTVAEAMILQHIEKTEQLFKAAQSLYN